MKLGEPNKDLSGITRARFQREIVSEQFQCGNERKMEEENSIVQ